MSVIVVYPRMACQLIRARETFFTARESASEWLLACVRAYVASLVGWLELIRKDMWQIGCT